MYPVSLGFMRHTRLSMRTSLVYLCLFSVLILILIINSESPGLTLRGNKMRFTLCLIFGIVCFLTCTLLSTQVHKQVYLYGDLCIMRILRKKHFGMLKSSLCLAGIFLWVQKLTKSLFTSMRLFFLDQKSSRIQKWQQCMRSTLFFQKYTTTGPQRK